MLYQYINSPGHLGPKNQAFVLEAIFKKGGVFKYPKAFECYNGREFKNEVAKLLEKHNVDIRRATTKYKYTHTAFVEAFNKEMAKLLLKPMHAQELQDPEKFGLYRYFCQSGEQHRDKKRRATHFIWSKNTYRLDRIVQEPGNRVFYYLQGGPNRPFVCEEFMHIFQDTQVPPDWAIEWK